MNSEFEIHTLSKLVHIDQKSLGKKTPEDFTFSYISLSDVSSGNISKTLEKHSFKSAPSRARRVLQNGDIIMATVRPNLQGFAKITEEFSHCVASTGFAVLSPKDNVSGEFIYQCLYSYQITKQIESLVVGSNYPAINSSDVAGLHIYTPSYPEQRKIAQILSTWDKAINTTERLIDNSKQQKKALMQQLLTGKKRLLDDLGKPFEGEWEEIKLESIVVRTQLGTTERTKENNDSNIVPLIKMGNLTWGGFSFSKLETVPKSIVDESLILQYGDFLFNTRNTPELVGKSAVWKGQLTEATFDNNINRITFNIAVNTDFICFYLNHGKGKATVNSLPAGSTSVAAIYWKDLKNIKVPLPNIEEQTKIVSVLVNADQEIELLEQQLADLKQEKKALMQQLLTGKRRVKI